MQEKVERIWVLLAKQKSGEATVEERAELNRLLAEDESVLYAEDILDKFWKAPLRPQAGAQRNRQWDRIALRLQQQKSRQLRHRWAWTGAAAMLLVLLALTVYVYQQRPGDPEGATAGISNIATPPDARSKIELPDGSQVWLNEGSRLVYDSKTFGRSDRKVRLEGEAYFEVKKSAGQPFMVSVGEVCIRVLGTAFNVNAYKENQQVEATLISGKIAVSTRQAPGKRIVLQPHESVVIATPLPGGRRSPDALKVPVLQKSRLTPADLARATRWIRHPMLFDNQSFLHIARRMEERYQVRIRFKKEGLKNLHFSGVLNDESLQEALEALQLSQPFDFYQQDSILWIDQKKEPKDRKPRIR